MYSCVILSKIELVFSHDLRYKESLLDDQVGKQFKRKVIICKIWGLIFLTLFDMYEKAPVSETVKIVRRVIRPVRVNNFANLNLLNSHTNNS